MSVFQYWAHSESTLYTEAIYKGACKTIRMPIQILSVERDELNCIEEAFSAHNDGFINVLSK